MPVIRRNIALTAGETNANALQGEQFEFIRRPTRIDVALVRDTLAAAGAGTPEATVFSGQELELEDAPLSDSPADSRGPILPDDNVVSFIAAPNDRLVLKLVETGGAAGCLVRAAITLTPLA